MSDNEIKADEQENKKPNTDVDQQALTGIGGWLILVVIGLTFGLLRLIYAMVKEIMPVFEPDIWVQLTIEGGYLYHPLGKTLLYFELFGNLIFIVFSIALLITIFKKLKLFPKLIIIFLALNLVFLVADYFLADLLPINNSVADEESLKEIFRSIIASAIWIPYFLVSKRVKLTFIN